MPEITVNLKATDSVIIEISNEELEELEQSGYLSDELAERAIEETAYGLNWEVDEEDPYEII